jgi:hypothetical protein
MNEHTLFESYEQHLKQAYDELVSAYNLGVSPYKFALDDVIGKVGMLADGEEPE